MCVIPDLPYQASLNADVSAKVAAPDRAGSTYGDPEEDAEDRQTQGDQHRLHHPADAPATLPLHVLPSSNAGTICRNDQAVQPVSVREAAASCSGRVPLKFRQFAVGAQ